MQKEQALFKEIKLTYLASIAVILLLFGSSHLLAGSTGLVTEITVGQGQQPPSSGSQGQSSPLQASSCGTTCWVGPGNQPGSFESAQGKAGVLGLDGKCYTPVQYFSELRCCSAADCPASKPLCSVDGRCVSI